jgi:phosphoribosylformylglycinamidine cyclo-ligase
MVAVVAPEAADRAIAVLAERDIPAWVCGQVSPMTGTATEARVELQSDYAG